MAGRHRLPPSSALHHHPLPLPQAVLARASPSPIDDPRRILALEDRIAVQHRDLQQLLADNQRLAVTHLVLKQDIAASSHDLRALADSAARAKAEADAEVRALFDRAARAEEEAKRTEAVRTELTVVRSDVERLAKERDAMAAELEKLKARVETVRGENGKVEEVMWEIKLLRSEIERGRAAVEYEKKAHAENLEQSQAMEKNMISMAREVEKLRAELANAEKRARAAAAASAAAKPGTAYAESYGRNEMAYGGSTYGSSYGFHEAQIGADGGSHYGSRHGSEAVPRGSYDIQQIHLQR